MSFPVKRPQKCPRNLPIRVKGWSIRDESGRSSRERGLLNSIKVDGPRMRGRSKRDESGRSSGLGWLPTRVRVTSKLVLGSVPILLGLVIYLCFPLNLTQLRISDHQNFNLVPPSGKNRFLWFLGIHLAQDLSEIGGNNLKWPKMTVLEHN